LRSLFRASVIDNHALTPHYSLLTLEHDLGSLDCKAGQFFMLQTGAGTEPLLKRPFSIFSHRPSVLQFLYRIVGIGTLRLSQRRKGELIELIGPLGRPYPKPEGPFLAVAGGTGIASIYCLLEENSALGVLFYGARDSREIVLVDRLEGLCRGVFYATDDGSLGIRGTVVDALEHYFDQFGPMPIYACGPRPMLKAVSTWARDRKLTCLVSLEERMACGIGACLSCVTKTYDGPKGICNDGPVFRADELIWD